ncbi:MAG: fibronectin type III domain-containing protein [Bacteroidota bacterium]
MLPASVSVVTISFKPGPIALGLGNIYYSGAFRGTVDIDPSGLTNSKSSGTDTAFDFFFSKYVPVEPFSSPGTISISNTGSTTATITLNALGGNYNDGYIVLYNIGSGVTATPVDNIVYNREDNPGNGVGKALITSGATVFTVTGLTPSSFYNISVFSYNGNASVSGNINYKTSIPITTTFTTSAVTAEPTGSPSNFNASAFTTSGYNVTFNAAVPAPTGYIAIRGAGVGTTPTTDPSDGVTYTVGSTIGNATVAYIGSALNFNETTLAFATTYNYKIYAYSGGGLTINYKQTSPAQGSTGTLGSLEPTAQPTNLVFTTETSTGYHYSFSASIGTNVSGYVGFRHLGSKPTFVPTDGVPLVAGDNADDGSFIAFFGTDLGFNAAGLTPSTTYYYSIYAFNGSGTTINYRQALPLKGNVTTTAFDDTTAPSISDKTPTSTTLSGGVTISVTATDNESGIDYLWVEYYPVNTDDYGDDDLESQGNDAYSFAIPASFNKGQGIEYKVHALDLAGNEAETQWKTIVLNVTDGLPIPYAFGTGKTNYRIISVPLNLANPKVTDVFDEFGTTYDKSKYRLFHFAGSNVTELTGTSTIELGKGYWFIAAEQTTVNSGAGTTVVTGIDKDVTIPIASGWNQIGNPYNFDVDWSDVVTANSDKTFTKYKTYEGGFNNGTSIKKMGGGFVMVSGVGDSQLVIPVYSSSRIAAPIPPNFNQTIDSDIWGVDLIVKSGDTENNFAGFGMHPDATEQADKFDDFTLPRFMDYLELNYNKKLFGSAYTKDIVPTSTQHVWEFELASNIDSDVIQVSWDNSNFENSALQLVLWDVNQQRAVDMKAQNRYSIDRSQSGKFKIFYGSESFVETGNTAKYGRIPLGFTCAVFGQCNVGLLCTRFEW